jgi:hypothetical protein
MIRDLKRGRCQRGVQACADGSSRFAAHRVEAYHSIVTTLMGASRKPTVWQPYLPVQVRHMTTIAPSANRRYLLPFVVALFITLIMGIAITVLDVLQPKEPVFSILTFIPGIISIAALSASGLGRTELNLRFIWIFLPGLLVLAAITVLLLPILGSSTGWTGWQWLPGLVYVPASGIAQEIYFRASLLPLWCELCMERGR